MFAIISLVSYVIDMDIISGRLGLLVTLNLIFFNVYNSVKGPPSRGFSYIEIWMAGMQIPILIGILEYAILLARKKYQKSYDTKTAKNIDKWTLIGCSIYISIFVIIYVLVVLTVSQKRACYIDNTN